MLKEKIIKDTSVYSGSTIISEIILIFRGIIIAKFLGPATYGLWNVLMVILNYSKFSHLGLLQAMNKELPYQRGAKNIEKVELIKDSVFSFILIASLTIGSLLIIFSFFLPYSTLIINGIRIVALIIIAEQFYLFFMMLLRVNNNFSLISKGVFLFAIINLVLTILLIFYKDLYGALFALLLSYILATIYISRKENFSVRFIKKFKETKFLLKIGFPLILLGFAGVARITVDKLLIIAMLTKTELGYYSLADAVTGFVLYVPSVISQIIFTRFGEEYGEKKDIKYLENYFTKPLFVISYFIPIIIGWIFIAIHLPIYYLLPKYIPSIDIVQILVFGSFFMAVTYTLSIFLITINEYYKLLMIQISAIILMVLLNYLFIANGFGIKGVAIGTIISYLFYSILILIYSFKNYTKNISDNFKFLIKVYFPIIYSGTVFLLINSLIITDTTSIINDISSTGLKLIIFSLLVIPLLYYINKKTDILFDISKIFAKAN